MRRHNTDEAAWTDETLPAEERIEALRLAMQEWQLTDGVDRHHVPVVTYEDAERELRAMDSYHVNENDWRQMQTFVRENQSDIKTLKTLFEEHCSRSEHMDAATADKIDLLSMNVTRVITKLDNGFTKDVQLLKETRLDKDDVRQVFIEMQQGNKKRGREWTMAVTAICTVVITVVAVLMGIN